MEKKQKTPLLQDGLFTAMRALDNQVAREMQRTPSKEELHGVQKWEPFQKRIEELAAVILDEFGERTVALDSILILSQTFSKVLQLIASDLGEDGLGKVRAEYCKIAMANISADATRVISMLQEDNRNLM